MRAIIVFIMNKAWLSRRAQFHTRSEWSYVRKRCSCLTFPFLFGSKSLQTCALLAGQPQRLTHPIDMFGFTCGAVNKWNGIEVDLRGKGINQLKGKKQDLS